MCESIDAAFSRRQSWRQGARAEVARGQGWEEGGMSLQKGSVRDLGQVLASVFISSWTGCHVSPKSCAVILTPSMVSQEVGASGFKSCPY